MVEGQADGAAGAAVDMLPGVAQAVAHRVSILFDRGVHSATEVVKAVSLGADLVGVGRPYRYGLALGGAQRCAHVLRRLPAEADFLMASGRRLTISAVRDAEAFRLRR